MYSLKASHTGGNGEGNGERRIIFWYEVRPSQVRKGGKRVSLVPLKHFHLRAFKPTVQPESFSRIAVPFAVPFVVPIVYGVFPTSIFLSVMFNVRSYGH